MSEIVGEILPRGRGKPRRVKYENGYFFEETPAGWWLIKTGDLIQLYRLGVFRLWPGKKEWFEKLIKLRRIELAVFFPR